MTVLTRMTPEVSVAVDSLMVWLNEQMMVHARKNGVHYSVTTITMSAGGRKFVKLTRDGNSVYCFIDVTTGEVFKPASWKAPAEHARGNVLDQSTWGCFGPYGIAYLRGPSMAGFKAPVAPEAAQARQAAPVSVVVASAHMSALAQMGIE